MKVESFFGGNPPAAAVPRLGHPRPLPSSLIPFAPQSSGWLTPPLHSRARHLRDKEKFLHFSDFCDIRVVTRIFILKILAIHLLAATSVWQFFLYFSDNLRFTLPKMKKFWKYIYAWKKFPCDIYFQMRFILWYRKNQLPRSGISRAHFS